MGLVSDGGTAIWRAGELPATASGAANRRLGTDICHRRRLTSGRHHVPPAAQDSPRQGTTVTMAGSCAEETARLKIETAPALYNTHRVAANNTAEPRRPRPPPDLDRSLLPWLGERSGESIFARCVGAASTGSELNYGAARLSDPQGGGRSVIRMRAASKDGRFRTKGPGGAERSAFIGSGVSVAGLLRRW